MDRNACQRRVYRLATLLTGNPNSATRVISAVVDAQPDLESVDSAHLDRLTVLRSREIRAGTIADDRLPREAATVLASLDQQPREAWVFSRVYRMPPREGARAMDCSVRAFQMHLDSADRAVESRTDESDRLAQQIRAFQLQLDVPVFHRQQLARRRWIRLSRRLIIAAVIVAMLIGGAIVLWPFLADAR